jgi:superoxide reductase
MAKINKYVDISTLDKEAKKDYIDRHSAFVLCESEGTKGEKLKVKVRVGDQYAHPDDFDHYIEYVQLWNGETLLGEARFVAGAMGNQPGNLEVDFYIVPQKDLKLTAYAYCTKHGLWESDLKEVSVK